MQAAVQGLRVRVPVAPVVAPTDPVDVVLGRFADYLRTQRGLAPATVIRYVSQVRPFLVWHGGLGDTRWESLRAVQVQRFVVARAAGQRRRAVQVGLTAGRAGWRWMCREAMAAAGLVGPDGTSKKANFDTVNEVLNLATLPLTAELAARFDPSMADSGSPYHVDAVATGNLMFGWREQAWRNAELLVSAPTPAVRATVAQQIELTAAAEATDSFSTTASRGRSSIGRPCARL